MCTIAGVTRRSVLDLAQTWHHINADAGSDSSTPQATLTVSERAITMGEVATAAKAGRLQEVLLPLDTIALQLVDLSTSNTLAATIVTAVSHVSCSIVIAVLNTSVMSEQCVLLTNTKTCMPYFVEVYTSSVSSAVA
jgi:hypothetical protein